MKQTTKKKNRFLAFLTSLCSAQSNRDCDNSKDKKKSKLKVNKIPRLTFQLDRVLVKVSRKNVAEQQFMENDVLTYHLEKYLATRFKQCDIAVFSGQFSNFLIQKIPFCLQIKSSKQELYESDNNYLLTNKLNKIKLKSSCIDLMAFQLYFGENQNPNEKSKNQYELTQKDIQDEINSNLDKIQQILRMYQKKIKNFAFICHKDLRLQDIHDLFLVFKENYFFEFQKVKKIQKTVCNVVYVSTETKFLRIDNSSLSQFVLCQFDKMKSFGNVKKNTQSTLGTDNSQDVKRKSKQLAISEEKTAKQKLTEQVSLSKQGIKRQGFYVLINRMFQKNLQLKVSQALAVILQSPDKKADKINWFLDLMHQKSPQSRDLIDSYRINPQQENDQEVNKTNSQLTPMFIQRFKDSNNFSKATAIFQTQNTPQDDFFLNFSPKKKDQYQTEYIKYQF